MGNELNPRMRVLKVRTKLKKEVEVKNMGNVGYDECQRLCLDFEDCETISYCVRGPKCLLSKIYDVDLKPEDMEPNIRCNLLAKGAAYTPRPYTYSYAESIGFWCSIAGLLVGAIAMIVFGVLAYNRGNRQ